MWTLHQPYVMSVHPPPSGSGEEPACLDACVQADVLLLVDIRVHLPSERVYHLHGSLQPTGGCVPNADHPLSPVLM